MPEGDTVFQAAHRLRQALADRVLTRTDFRVPQYATVHTHFRMDGTWRTFRAGKPWKGGPQWQVRIVLSNSEFEAVGYRIP